MAKQLNVDLKFNADVTAAVTNLRNLQQSLTAISATPIPIGTKISSEMQTAINSAKQLQFHLTNAFNIKTGNLDLTKLNTSLKASGQNLSDLSAGLLNAGMKGEQAFINIQRAVTTAGVQINSTQTMMGQFLATLKNTARWQLSSSLLHGFIGGLQSAIGYAKDLDKSLNNIRIVTGYSSDYMAEFAEEANKAAKALNTTTTKYTDASLIYFQQGLSKEEVKERADITVKMANVTQQSAEIVSDQLTAVWNNFDDGTKSLEYYADVMTALGAATASSSDEIAGGLEKFAAIGETIGLSYEYAASALATITANTRQSEEVVGTALKTIFARIQGLKLGETLEDGTTLNKYSQALETVGVHIYNAQGGLKDMDSILDDLGKKWQTLTNDQQTALAQTVAGLRQYNQFIALMDNWDDGTGDSMLANLETSYNAVGALQGQADLYAESWAAASDKVKASLEDVWNSLIPTEGIIDVTNGFAQILDVLASAIEGFGGFKSILLMISSIVLTKMGPSIAAGIDQGLVKIQEFGNYALHLIPNSIAKWKASLDTTNNSYSVMNNHLGQITKQTTNAAQQSAYYEANLRGTNEVLNQSQLSIAKAANSGIILTDTFKTYIRDMSQINNLQALITKNAHLLTSATKEQLSGMQQQLLSIAEKKAQEQDNLELLRAERETLVNMGNERMMNLQSVNNPVFGDNAAMMQMGQLTNQIAEGWGRILVAEQDSEAAIVSNAHGMGLWSTNADNVQSTVTGVASTYSTIREVTEQVGTIYQDNTLNLKQQKQAALAVVNNEVKRHNISKQTAYELKAQLSLLKGQKPTTENMASNVRRINFETTQVLRAMGYTNEQIQQLNSNAVGVVYTTAKWKQYVEEYKNVLQQTARVMQNGLQSALSWGGALQGLASGASKVAMGLNSIMNFIEQLKSGDADFTTMLVSGTMAFSMGLSGLMAVLNGVVTVLTTFNTTTALTTALTGLGTKAKQKDIKATIQQTLITKLNVDAEKAATIAKTASKIASEKGTAAAIKYTLAQLGLNAALLPMLAIVAALAVVIGAIVIGYQKWKENSPEGQLKAAREESKALTEQLNETRKAAQDLKSGFDDYNQIAEKLAKCTKGTQEWTDALKENNDKVLELMEQYPELATMIHETTGQQAVNIDADGKLVIADWAIKEMTLMYNEKVGAAKIAANLGNQQVREKQIEQLEQKVSKNKNAQIQVQVDSEEAKRYQKNKHRYGGLNPYTETADGSIYKTQYGQGNNTITDSANELIAKYGIDKAAEQISTDLSNLSVEEQKKVKDLIASEKELRDAVNSNTAAIELENQAAANELLSGYKSYDESEYKGYIATIVGNNMEQNEWSDNNIYSKRLRNNEFDTNNNSYRYQYWEAYKQATNMTDANGYHDVQFEGWTDKGAKYSYYNDENKKQEDLVATYGVIGNTIAGQEIAEQNQNYGQAVSDYMATFTSEEQTSMFTAAMTGEAGALSEDVLKMTDDQVQNIAKSFVLTQENIEKMGPALKKAGLIAEDVDLENLTEADIKKINKQIQDTTIKITQQKKAFEKNKGAISGYLEVLNGTVNGDVKKAAEDTSKALGEIFGLENLKIQPEVLKENEGLINNFLNNTSEDAGAKLQEALASEIQAATVQDAKIDIIANVEGENAKQQVSDILDSISGQILENDFKVGIEIDPASNAKFFESCNALITAAGWTKEEAQKQFKDMGFDVKLKDVDVEKKTKQNYSYYKLDQELTDKAGGVPQFEKTPTNIPIETTQSGGAFAIETITPMGSSGGNIDKINDKIGSTVTPPKTGTINPKGGGDSNKNTPKDKTFKEKDKKETKLYEDEFDRYYDITQALEEYNRELEEIQERKDELWGADKLAAMDAEKKKLGEITVKQKEYLKAISGSEDGTFKGGYLKTDMDALKQLDSDAKFDENGKLINYEELTQKWLKELNSAQEVWNTGMENATNTFNANKEAENADETYDTTKTTLDDDLEKAEDAYEKRKAALDKWQETYDLNKEEKQKLEDALHQRRQINYEELEYKLEIRVELNENDIADIEHQLERLGDNNVYASAERIAVIQKNAVSYRNIADAQIEAIKEAERLYQQYLASDGKEGISQEDYMARLKESKEALQEAEMSIRDGITQIGDELENTFDLVDEKLDQQFTKFDRLIELMDHYKNVVSLTEGEASYEEFNKILRASQKVLRDRIEADKSEVAMWESRRKQLEADIATLPEDSPAKREAEEALQAIMEKEADAKSQLMSDIEQLGEYAREIFENSIEQAMKDFEDEMFGRPLNSIIESIEMMNSRQEELLTTTNKIYETNKLIRNVEKDIEATTNKRAKQAFAEFQNKVKQKQEQNELTKFELDLLTAEYEMTKAQIALEEAQNAKDTVRLTRDAEGNYGYVYTANEDKVSDAEQALDDATNNYYNTALEGTQKYQDQIYQHIQEWEEKVKEVYLDQTLSEEEKNKKIKEINDTYNTLITQDKNLYYMAVGAMQESAYNTQVDYDLKGIESAENWFDECDGFLSDLEDAQDEYDRNTKEVADHTEENFGRMSTAINGTKTASQQLVEDMTKSGGIIDTCNNELKDSIDNATEAWQKYIEALEEAIRLTDEAMKKNHDTQLTETYKGDYAAEIQERLANGADYDDYDIQQLLQARWDKMGGVDNTDYQALINAGGTPEQIALWEVLRRFKIDKTNWSTVDGDWAKDIRATKMDQDFAQLIINYFKSSSHARWSDETVQGYLAARQAKIDEGHESAKGAISNEELKNYVAQLLNKKPEQLKTGGYTGSWGPEGKLAVLHEKELVLNAEDTKNFLSAAGILREISQMLDRDALIASLGAINLRAMTLNSPADQVLQQEVTIHADFPNVTDHNEIELAIDNLINAASQHAYRT